MKIIKNSFQLIVSLMILAAALVVARGLFMSRPEVPKTQRIQKSTLVKTLEVRKTDEPVILTAFGTVQAHQTLTLHPEVGGRIVSLSDNLIKGGRIIQGEPLLKIDPRDYETAIQQEIARVTRAEFELKVEEGQRVVAEREWALLDDSIPSNSTGQELALRKPHLEEKRAALRAARSRLEKAVLDLERATLISPFNAIVLDENVEKDQLVTRGTSVATLVGTDRFRIQVSLPLSQLEWIETPGAKAWVSQEIGKDLDKRREGLVTGVLGDLTPGGRMAQILVTIDRPMEGSPPLLLGTYVRVEIEGPTLEGVIVLPRIAIRDSNQLWIKTKEGKLAFRKVEVGLRRKDTVVITSGLEEGEHVIVSTLPLPIPGMKVHSYEE